MVLVKCKSCYIHTSLEIAKIRDQYPTLSECTYLNVPAHGLLGEKLVRFRESELNLLRKSLHDKDTLVQNGMAIEDPIAKARSTVANFLGSDPALTALIPNFSLAYERFLQKLDESHTVIAMEDDYPSIVYPLRWCRAKVIFLPPKPTLEETFAQLDSSIDPTLFVFSLVHHVSGKIYGEQELNQLKKTFPDLLLLADCTQHIGARMLTDNASGYGFRECAIDIIAASCYKWLCAGNGNGFLAVKPSVGESLFSDLEVRSADADRPNDRGTFLGYFEPGHVDPEAMNRMGFKMQEYHRMGMQAIQQRIESLSEFFIDQLQKTGLNRQLSAPPVKHQFIFHFQVLREIFEAMIRQGFICSWRADGLRIGIHFFNTEEELKNFVTTLAENC